MSPEPTRIRVAYSPDADDAFMFFGLHEGAVDTPGLVIEREMQDIESLNRRAIAGELDVTAVSFAAWPRLSEHYDLLTVGSSFGLGYGPKLVSKEPKDVAELSDGVVAIPGELTSAALALRLMLPGQATKAVPFDEIPARVAAGDVAAGVVIHEGQVTWEQEGFHLIQDLGVWWSEETSGLPLPLGGNAVHRRLSPELVAGFKSSMAASIAYAEANRVRALEFALQFGRGVDLETGGEFVGLYVNELTLDPGDAGRRAVDELYRRGAKAGLLPKATARWA
jgi:1,4-dihydroxy-6-naphthoate synthase